MNEEERNARTISLIGHEAADRLKAARITVFGLGGVGSACAEALARCGIGTISVVDHDVVCPSNLNRQIIATAETIGLKKTEVCCKRLKSVSPGITVIPYDLFYLPATADKIDLSDESFVVDCIDNITAKLELISHCYNQHIPVISCMGTGNRLDPFQFCICDIFDTCNDALARIMRKELRKKGIPSLTVLYSKENPVRTHERSPSSISFVPPVAGMMIASEVVKRLINDKV